MKRNVLPLVLGWLLLALGGPAAAAQPDTAAPPAAAGEPGALELLRQAVGGRWVAEGRLSFGLGGAPTSLVDGGDAEEEPDWVALAGVEVAIGEALRVERSARNLQVLGLYRLVRGEYDQALAALEEASRLAPDSAAIQSDLAVVYLERGWAQDRPFDRILALEAADRAVELDGESPEARFNLALALEGVELIDSAMDAWEGFLKALPDGESPLAAAVVARRQRLSSPDTGSWQEVRTKLESGLDRADPATARSLVEGFVRHAGLYVLEDLLPGWAEASAGGDPVAAERQLALASWIAGVLAELGSDQLAKEVVQDIEASIAQGAMPRIARWQETLTEFRQARDHQSRGELEAALNRLGRVLDLAEELGSPLSIVADFYRAQATMLAHAYLPARITLESLSSRLTPEPSRLWSNKVEMLLGLLDLYAADYGPALTRFEGLVTSLAGRPPAEFPTGLYAFLAESLALAGRESESWRHRLRALKETAANASLEQRLNVTYEAVAILDRQGMYRAAAWLPRDLQLFAGHSATDRHLVEVLTLIGRTRFRRGAPESGAVAFEQAAEQARRVSDTGTQAKLLADLDAEHGSLLIDSDVDAGLELLQRAIDAYEAINSVIRLPALYLSHARSLIRLERWNEARTSFERALQLGERTRTSFASPQERIAYFASVQEAFDEGVRLELDQFRDPRRALELADAARSRSLLDLLAGQDTGSGDGPAVLPALTLDEVQSRLPPDLAVIEYALLPDRVAIWLVRRDRLDAFTQSAEATVVQGMVESFRLSIEGRRALAATQAVSAELYQLLVAPLRPYLHPGDTLVFVPDKSLWKVPFDALWSPASSRYLIEDHPLATAPGLRVLARALAQAPVAGRDKPPSVLAIGLSDFDRDRFPILDPLPEAEPEAEAVAAHYPLSKTLIGGRATSSEILAALPHYPIVHFATHVLSLPGLEPTSSLVVAPGATSDGLLDLAALGRMNLIQLRLAVLSGCRSVTTFARGREGIDGVARPFLAAGVPAVVASLWDVDDRSSKRFWSALHRLLACGVPLAEAMRTAKVEWIRSLEPAFRSPANWAVFQVLGNPEVAVSFDRTRRERCLTSSK